MMHVFHDRRRSRRPDERFGIAVVMRQDLLPNSSRRSDRQTRESRPRIRLRAIAATQGATKVTQEQLGVRSVGDSVDDRHITP